MQITKEDLKEKDACKKGLKWFLEHFKDGTDVETLKQTLTECERWVDLMWLYINFKLTGEYISYCENGNIWEKCFYKNGMRDGEYIEYDKNGYILIKCFYKN